MTKGDKLNTRVWRLFEHAGFITKPNSSDQAELEVNISSKKRKVDLYAEDVGLSIKIIGSNKSGAIRPSFSGHVHDLAALRNAAGAGKAILVATGHQIDPTDIKHASDQDIKIWTEDDLLYYEALVDSIGEYAKYEIIHSLDLITTEERETHKVLALRFQQPVKMSGTEIFIFTLVPEFLLKTSVIYRRAQGDANAYQRMLKKSRLPRIATFVSRNDAILPTDIILHLSDKVTIDEITLPTHDKRGQAINLSNIANYGLVVLGIPKEYASLEIIDGQHRLFGFVSANSNAKSGFNLVVAGIKKLNETQKRDAFIAINDTSRRVDANLVAYLKYSTDDNECKNNPELMAIRIIVELNKTTPLRGLIRVLDVGSQVLTLKGLSGYDLKGLVGQKGQLRKVFPTNNPRDYITALRTYFSMVKGTFGKEWNDPRRFIVATNRGVTAFLKLLRSILKAEGQFPTSSRIEEYLVVLKKHFPDWQLNQLKKTYVGSQGWKEFHRDMITAIRKDDKFKSFHE